MTAAVCPPMVTLDTVSEEVKVVVITSPALARALLGLLETSSSTSANGATVSTPIFLVTVLVFPAASLATTVKVSGP